MIWNEMSEHRSPRAYIAAVPLGSIVSAMLAAASQYSTSCHGYIHCCWHSGAWDLRLHTCAASNSRLCLCCCHWHLLTWDNPPLSVQVWHLLLPEDSLLLTLRMLSPSTAPSIPQHHHSPPCNP